MASQVENAPSDASQGFWVAIFWLLVVIAGLGWYFYEAEADVLLDVATQPELVNGAVAFAGVPLANGVVRVVVFDAGTRRYLAGMSLPVDAAGRFTSQGLPRFAVEENSHPPDAGKVRSLRVTASYYGTRFADKAKDKAAPPKAVTGESTLYINSSPPLGPIFVWSMTTVALVLLVLQLWVFTGDLGQRKARTLFVLMYFFTFWALALPLVLSLIVAQNKYLVDSMENSPLGLVKARTAALAETQWLINIGGTVKPPSIGQRVEVDAKRVADAVAKVAAAVAGASAVSVAPAETIAVIEDTGVTIQGGVTVPFFMVLLAVFGAGINMTLKVPAIQREYEDVLSKARSTPLVNPLMPWRLFSQTPAPATQVVVQSDTAGDIRRRLIENYMYLLSAPLLVIAMYYLLQVMAAQVTQPVLVLMALATGLVSKAVIGGIIKFAEDRLPDKDTPLLPATANAAIVAMIEEAKAKQLEARDSQKLLAEAIKSEARALAFAEAADAAEKKAIAEKDSVDAAHAAGQATAADAAAAQARVKSATSEAESMQARAHEASAHASSAEKDTSAKCSEADAAIQAMQAAAGRQAAVQFEATEKAKDKQSEALAAAETTQQAAETATVKQAEAAQAMEAVQPSAGVAAAGGRAAAAGADSASAAVAAVAEASAEASAAAAAEPATTPKPPAAA